MRLLILDTDACGCDLAWRAVEAGHDVKWWIPPAKDRTPSSDGIGFPGVERVASWQPHMQWAKQGVIVNLFNDRKLTKELDKWRSFGFPIFGPTSESAELEHNRGKGMKFMEAHGIEVPAYHTFKTLDECIKFAWKAQEPFVFKVLGDEIDKSLSFVASDPADLVGFLEMKRDGGLVLKGECILQEKVNKICDMGVSGWIGKEGFLPNKWNINFEHKKLMPGDFGPNTGEMGTVCRYVSDSILADEMLKPFEESLVKMGHIGDFDIEVGITDSGKAIPYEFSARFGWPSTQILMASHTCDPVPWMRECITTGNDLLTVDDRVAMGVIMARPPFPSQNEDAKSNVGYPITGIEDVWEHVSPWQMMIGEGPIMMDGKIVKGSQYKTTGEYICVVTGHGADVHDAQATCYAAVDKIKFADRIVRNDVGNRLEKELPKLKALGYEEVPDF